MSRSLLLALVAISFAVLTEANLLHTTIATTNEDPFTFFKAAAGNWHGHPSATTIGPVRHDLNLSVVKADAQNSGGAAFNAGSWALRHNLAFTALKGTWQLFWVQNDVSTSGLTTTSPAGNMSYCTLLANWTGPAAPVNAIFLWQRQSLSKHSVTWFYNTTASQGPFPGGWTGTWTLTLRNNNTQLHSFIELGGATHLDVTMTRTAVAQNFSSWKVLNQSLPGNLPDVCGVTQRGQSVDSSMTAAKPQSACPLGFTSGSMPKFVQDKIAAKKKKAQEEEEVKANNGGYENCFVINPVMNFRVRWNWNTATKSIEVHFSANKTGDYVALGILPQWPYMRGMDIVLGSVMQPSGLGCVQNLYAPEKLGAPISNEKQVLAANSTSAWLTDGGQTINVKFTRPWNTGHHNLKTYRARGPTRPNLGWELAFAQGPIYATGGEASTTCAFIPGYHSPVNRGVAALNWFQPELMPEFKKCKYW